MGPYTFGKRCSLVGFKERNDSFAQMANAGCYAGLLCVSIFKVN